jgi:hypothetical protein
MDRPLLILDLDETLVYATKKSVDVGHDFRVLDYYVRKRPHLDEFLERIFDSSGTDVVVPAGEILRPTSSITSRTSRRSSGPGSTWSAS